MTEGEVMQSLLDRHPSMLSEREYFEVVERKTGALIAAACRMGAILGDADSSDQEALFQFGLLLGTAYQIADDTLDYVGQGDRLGKALGNDIREGKMTLPLLHLLHHLDDTRRSDVQTMLKQSCFDRNDIGLIVELMNAHGSIQYSRTIARTYVDKAKSMLIGFGESTAKQALCIAADYMVTRDH